VAGQAAAGSGVGPSRLHYVLGITKAYCTRVGGGPFPTELDIETKGVPGEQMSTKGREFGTVTGRKRRCGWLDLAALKRSIIINGVTGLCITKLDVLDGLEELKLCTGYMLDGKRIDLLPMGSEEVTRCEPIYETMKGWSGTTFGAQSWDALPQEARAYLHRIEEICEIPIDVISTGPERDETILRRVAQTSVSFSDHRAHVCGRDESRLRRAVGAQAFEYLLAQALAEIGEERVERQELEANRSLLRARLRLLRQQGPGLGSLYGNSPPAASSEQARLEAELLDNEKQLAAIGGNESVLEMELDSLREVLENPQRYLRAETRHLRLTPMNIVVDGESSEAVVDLDVHLAELSGAAPVRRAVVVARVGREQMAQAPTMNLADAARYL
jgi:hypothetical protein